MRNLLLLQAATALVTAACGFPELDLEGKTGPCAPGWVGEPGEICRLPEARATDSGSSDVGDAQTSSDRGVDSVSSDASALDAPDGMDTDGAGGPPDLPDAGSGCSASYILCDDFEDPLHPLWTPSGDSTAVALEFSTGRSRSGSTAVRASVSGTVVSSFGPNFGHILPEPLRATTVYVRAYVYLEPGDFVDINVLGFSPISIFDGIVDLKLRNNGFGAYIDSGDQYLPLTPGPTLPQEEWICVSTQIDIGNSGGIQVSSGGETTVTGTGDTEPADGVSRFYLGTYWTRRTQTPVVYWIDDVTVDDAPLPCE